MNSNWDAWNAMEKEWENLRKKGVWDMDSVSEYWDVRSRSLRDKVTIHFGKIAPICVEKNSQLEEGNPLRKYKGRIVFFLAIR